MACWIQAITEQQMEALIADPSLTQKVFEAHSDGTAEKLFGEPLCEELDLDKSWAIINYLLIGGADMSGSDEELISGEAIGEQGDYYGPYLRDIADTQKFAAHLQSMTWDRLLLDFDCQKMLEYGVYLVWEDEIGDEECERDLREYVSGHYQSLREYVLRAAASQCDLLLWVN